MLTGGAVYASNMLMQVIDRRVERAKAEVLDELESVEARLADVESRALMAAEDSEIEQRTPV